MHRSLNPKSSRLRETLVGPELSALHAAHATVRVGVGMGRGSGGKGQCW